MIVMTAQRARAAAPRMPAAAPGAERRPSHPGLVDELIASHRGALLALAPYQDERMPRLEAGWHIAQLGRLLRLRDCGVTPQ